MSFILTDDKIINIKEVHWVDISRLERDLRIEICHGTNEISTATDIQAIEILMLLKPSALEGRRLKWPKHAWIIHNLIGHPVMQILALFGFKKTAIWVHDGTVPKPTKQGE